MIRHAFTTIVITLALFGRPPAFAQLAPTGTHYAGRSSDTGYGAVSGTGGLPTSVAFDFPAARGGIPIPIALTYGRKGVGAGGLGWDVPLSFVRRDATLAHRRPSRQGVGNLPPQQRERLVVSIAGRTVEMVQSGAVWLARRDAPDLVLRPGPNNTWQLIDGHGQEFIFTAPEDLDDAGETEAPHIPDLWLLSTVTSATSVNRIELQYQVTPWSFTGGHGIEINLISARYNTHPNTSSCLKNEILLMYQDVATNPLSLSLLGDVPLVRMRTLLHVDVTSRALCGSSPVRLRQYKFDYTTDADTQQPRLSAVRVFGRVGSNEEAVSLPVASYTYGSATSNGKLVYQRGTDIAFPAELGSTPPLARSYHDSSASSPDGGETYVNWQNLIDMSGDGRPDLVFKQNGQLRIAMNRPATGGATRFADSSSPLSSPVYSGRPLGSNSLEGLRYGYGWQNHDHVWRQAVDVNGDGRIDVIDAAEEAGVWTIYLNTPGSPVTWVKRKFRVDSLRQVLKEHGHDIEDGHVPLARRTTGYDLTMSECWKRESGHWVFEPSGFSDGHCPGDQLVHQHTVGDELTYTEWEIRDLNGDGYPDVVFNSSPVRNIDFKPLDDEGCPSIQPYCVFVPVEPLVPTARNNNAIKAVFNVVGVMFDDHNPFSAPVTLANHASCGVTLWRAADGSSQVPEERNKQTQACGIDDVNGDGIVDRIDGTVAYLGTGDSFEKAQVTLQLPSAPEQSNPHHTWCTGTPGQIYEPRQVRGLRDLTGDGIPDFVEYDWQAPAGERWRAWIGTGAGFQSFITIEAPSFGFSISNTLEACAGEDASTLGGLYDVDGDGQPEVLEVFHSPLRIEVYRLGKAQAGRITSIDNGYGAVSSITYRSAKEDDSTAHQVPFPEIVVTAIATTGTHGLGGTLSAVRYAYGGAEMFFDPMLDAFTMRAYGTTIEVHGTGQEERQADYAIARSSYQLPPFNSVMSDAERFDRYQKVGKVRDTYVLSSNVERDPWELLRTFAPYTDMRRTGGTHNEWATRYVPLAQYSGTLDCTDVIDPYDWAMTFGSNIGHASCAARGFSYVQSSDVWSGTQPPGSSASNVETYFEVTGVDEYGNVTSLKNENDRFDPSDDICVEMTYGKPTTATQVLSALATRRITNCVPGKEMRTLSYESWEFDELPVGYVGLGRVTSRTTERYATDNGEYFGSIREYEIGYDSVGNPSYIATAREYAIRTIELAYDEFGLAATTSTLDASGIAPLTTESTRDPVSLAVEFQRDANGTVSGSERDGFGRPTRATVQIPGGELGVIATVSYESAPKRAIRTKTFRDPVPPSLASTAAGEETTTSVDELGRPIRTTRALGTDYAEESLVVLSRTYDGLGRVTFEADPHPASKSSALAYGTSYHFDTFGELACSIRGYGPQLLTSTTDTVKEVFPTCYTRMFSNHRLQTAVSTPDSLDAGTPQTGTVRIDTSTAIGRVLSRETSRNGTKLELAEYTYDPFGQLATLTRFGAPNASPMPLDPVTRTLRHDSRGQTISSIEPQMASRSFTYSDWGEPTAVYWTDTSGVSFAVETSYDALGRISHSQELRAGNVIPETEYEWMYDIGEKTPLLTPSFTAGRLTKTHSPIGDMHLSYDGFGRVNARAFTEKGDEWYGEKHELHADGSLDALEFQLPDTKYATERYEYAYDSASRLVSVIYDAPSKNKPLYSAVKGMDVWGRVRSAEYGTGTSYRATYADVGRRLLLDETITLPTGEYRTIAYKAYDAADRELQRDEVNSTKITTLSVYDALGRLVRSLDGMHGQSFDRRFTYDALGNLRQSIDLVNSEQTNAAYTSVDRDRICRIDYGPAINGPCNVDHDDLGNIVGQPTPGKKPGYPPGHRKLTYYPSGAVAEIEQDPATATFRYDGSGEIFSLDVSGPFLRDARRDRRFGLFDKREVDIEGVTQSIIERHIPGPGGIVASRRGADESFVFPFADGRGTRTATNGSTFIQDVSYEPFGKAMSTGAPPRSPDHSHYQWNGGDALADLGLVHLGARLYDPNIGRFLSRDPLFQLRSASAMNPYAFAHNDPVNFSDPTGLCESPDGTGCTKSFPIPLDFPNPFDAGLGYGHIENVLINPELTEFDAHIFAQAYENPALFAAAHFTNPGEMIGAVWRHSLRNPPSATRIIGGLKVMAGGAAFYGGFLLCSSGLGCVIGGPLMLLGADVAGSGAAETFTGKSQPTVIGHYVGPEAQALEEAFVEAAGTATQLFRAAGLLGGLAESGGLCFAAGTPVKTPKGLVAIESVSVGDLVWSRDPSTGQEDWMPVTRRIVTEDRLVVDLMLTSDAKGDTSELLRVTPSHPLWSIDDKSWKAVKDLGIGERVDTLSGPMHVWKVDRVKQSQTVYNFEVSGNHTYFVGSSGVWVHNTGWCPGANLRGKSIKYLQRNKPKGWRTQPADQGSGWKWIDENGVERLRFMRGTGENPMNAQWARQSNGYFRWKNASDEWLDINGNVVNPNDTDFLFRTHIPYEGK